jgi:hypothetical protein
MPAPFTAGAAVWVSNEETLLAVNVLEAFVVCVVVV